MKTKHAFKPLPSSEHTRHRTNTAQGEGTRVLKTDANDANIACLRCAQTKVRCDRRKPQCGLCEKKQIVCQYRSISTEHSLYRRPLSPVGHQFAEIVTPLPSSELGSSQHESGFEFSQPVGSSDSGQPQLGEDSILVTATHQRESTLEMLPDNVSYEGNEVNPFSYLGSPPQSDNPLNFPTRSYHSDAMRAGPLPWEALDLLSAVGAGCSEGFQGLLNGTRGANWSVTEFLDSISTFDPQQLTDVLDIQIPSTVSFINTEAPVRDTQTKNRLGNPSDLSPPADQANLSWPMRYQPISSTPDLNLSHISDNTLSRRLNEPSINEFDNDAHLQFLATLHRATLPDNQYERIYARIAKISPRIFNHFLQLYFKYFHPIYQMLHQPSFKPSEQEPALVGIVIAIGALYSQLEGSFQLAKAFAEIVIRHAGHMLTGDLRNSRSLPILQTLVLWGVFARWCGDPRYLELAESYRGSWGIIARRLFLFDDVARPHFESDITMETRWHVWAQFESRRRTALVSFCADLELTAFFSAPPLYCIGDLKGTLPCDDRYFNAGDSSEWASLLPSGCQVPPPTRSISSILQMIACSRPLPPDLSGFSELLIVQAVHVSVWAYKQFRLLCPRVPRSIIDPILSSLEYMGCSTPELCSTIHSDPLKHCASVFYHIARLRSFVAFDVLQAISGRGTSKAADIALRSVVEILERDPAMARRVVWHSGQLFSLSRLLASFQIPFVGMAVFYASLCILVRTINLNWCTDPTGICAHQN